MIVTLLNQQGGVGKTTLALHLAGGPCQRQRVAVIDADPEGCALERSEMREQERLRGASASLVSRGTPLTARRRKPLATLIA